ncbi:C13 family peptidase [Bosea sp. R86505]|uniref:C13 family peptidase n=1 Tax=Bosea sp. R86505 TaxID=3101710 RepID=UPI0036703B01
MPPFYLLPSLMRAAIWRPFLPAQTEPHPLSLIVLALLASAAAILFERILGGEGSSFQLYGINSALLGSVIVIAFAGLCAPRGRRATCIAVLLGLSILSSLALALAAQAAAALSPADADADSWSMLIFWMAIALGIVIWAVGAVATVLRSLDTGEVRRPILRASGALLGILVMSVLMPYWPTFPGQNFSKATANVWELISAYQASRSEPSTDRVADENGWADIELIQSRLLDQKIAAIAPRRPEAPNLFVLGVAGWSDQSVFLSETRGALGVIAERFNTGGHSMRLINNRATVSDDPIATVTNLGGALRGIAARMDTQNDALLILLTSHGNSMGVGLEFDPLVRRILSPTVLKRALYDSGIKNRIIIVSACYSGVFVPDLADENTVVITASSATTNSFGCSNEREWTYFGDAFFNLALRTAPTLAAAFEQAKALVSEWEQRDGLKPSQPQIHIGESISRLMPLVGAPTLPPKEGQEARLRN